MIGVDYNDFSSRYGQSGYTDPKDEIIKSLKSQIDSVLSMKTTESYKEVVKFWQDAFFTSSKSYATAAESAAYANEATLALMNFIMENKL